MFINFWYPALQSADLGDDPVHMRMLGQDFVLFRDSQGAAHCLSNVCVHRGGSLAHGKRKGDCIECPYHGWQFDGDGKCTRIPSMGPKAKIPARAKIDAYPVEEKYGLVFAFLGDLPERDRAPIMDIPEYGGEGWTATVQQWEFDFDYKRSIENGIDSAHNEFVHPTHGFSGSWEEYHIEPLKLEETEWGTGFFHTRKAPPLPDRKMRAASGRTEDAMIETGTGHYCPASLWTYIHPSKDMFIHQYAYETPVDASHTRIFLINLRNFLIEEEHDARMKERNQYVAFQDRDVLERMRPVITPRANVHEVFVEADSPIARYREKIKRWESWGWRIDSDRVEAAKDRVAYAIPSPRRRASKGWVLDPVPLVPADKTVDRAMRTAAE